MTDFKKVKHYVRWRKEMKSDNLDVNKLPSSIQKLIFSKSYTVDSFGKSGSGVYVFDDCVLKIVDAHDKQFREHNDVSVQVMDSKGSCLRS